MTHEPFGPKMRALPSDKMRAFVLDFVATGQANATQSCREAGYKDNGGSAIRVQAHSLLHDQRILDAIQEVSAKNVTALLPAAVNALGLILTDPAHRDFGKIAAHVCAIAGISPLSKHQVEHTLSADEMKARIAQLALDLGIDPAQLLGTSAEPVPSPDRAPVHAALPFSGPGGSL